MDYARNIAKKRQKYVDPKVLTHDFPRWPTVYHYYFRKWRIDGSWERFNKALREQECV
jgi:hypothetical protein